MKRSTRRILFWLAVAVFGAASYLVVLVAQGYKYDFARNVFVRTGAIAVTANVDAQLYVDDTAADPMSFLTHRTGVNRLLPDMYSVRVIKDGYSTWRKTATVQEGLLTDFPSVLLVPLDQASSASVRQEITTDLAKAVTLPKKTKTIISGDFTLTGTTLFHTVDSQETTIATGVLGFQLADDSSRIMWYTSNEVWVLWLANTNYQPFRAEGDKMLITRFVAPIVHAAWFHDHDHLVADLGTEGYRIFETDTRGGVNIVRI